MSARIDSTPEMAAYSEREFTAFIDRVMRRQKRGRGQRRTQAEAWIDPPAVTRQKTYDQETEQWLAKLHDNERRTA